MFRPHTEHRLRVLDPAEVEQRRRRQGLVYIEEYMAEIEHNAVNALRLAQELELVPPGYISVPTLERHLSEIRFVQAEVRAQLT